MTQNTNTENIRPRICKTQNKAVYKAHDSCIVEKGDVDELIFPDDEYFYISER